ncbi:short-chain dehydrogenase [Taibaiella sp. KBW10]|uniref:SDR family NAD(P)-dependent oxidoreductase n=1 Tax=Taibaiella sp. KBW10 TaxID=2153357 RepID=UPI000F5B44BF|nr:SDR family NAD(P)-dependent oxidoreductase [Taibaiella sp. KBW10]RQO29710.1 short-chain dehydrogenase [Taibaiella sp. KBW10]
MQKEKFVLITGAGKGLGKAFGTQCAQLGYNLILIALPGENVQSLARHIQYEYAVKAHCFEIDITDQVLLEETINHINACYEVFFLINNAGVGGTASITSSSFEDMDGIIRLNVRATVQVTKLMLPNLLQSPESYIMNVSSMAALTPIAYKTVYPASKAFIASFSLGLREELKDQGLSVSIVYPGAIMTNCNVSGRILAQGAMGRLGLVNTDAIAQTAIRKTLKKQAKIVPGLWNRITSRILQWIPVETKLRLISTSVKRELQFT